MLEDAVGSLQVVAELRGHGEAHRALVANERVVLFAGLVRPAAGAVRSRKQEIERRDQANECCEWGGGVAAERLGVSSACAKRDNTTGPSLLFTPG